MPRFLRLWLAALLLPVVAAMLSGCTATKTTITVSAITFADANGNSQPAPASLVAGATAYAEVTLSGDTALLGADWAVACGSALPPGTPLPPGTTEDTSCGTFTPVHTASGPVPSYATSGSGIVTLYTAPAAPPKQGVVTLYAAATADHSRYASFTLPVVGIAITIQFGSVLPASIPVNGTASFKAVLANDYVAGGANWTVTCGASACGAFNPTKTASGVATTFQAPASMPPAGNVVITATSVTDPTKSVSATIAIASISVSVDDVSSSVVVGETDLITATVANDVSNEGVDWTLSCGSAGACGSITSHTASGVAATFTAPADVPSGATVMVQAASTAAAAANQSATGSVVLTISPSSGGGGIVTAGSQPVRGASVSLYAAGTHGNGSLATLLAPANASDAITDENGRFRIPPSSACPSPSALLYLVARGGNAGEGENPNLVSIVPLGRCDSSLGAPSVTLNEVTTVASAYALAAFMGDSMHVGAVPANVDGFEAAMATVRDLVDPATGTARSRTADGSGEVPQAEMNTLAGLVNRCASTAGGRAGDGTPCGRLFQAAGGNTITDTLEAVLSIARSGAEPMLSELINNSPLESGAFQPVLNSLPASWKLAVKFDPRMWNRNASVPRPSVDWGKVAAPFIDKSGNLWTFNTEDHSITEFIGYAALEPEFGQAPADSIQPAGKP